MTGTRAACCATWFAMALLALPQAASAAAEPETARSRPLNVLFIVVDDLRSDLGCYGHPFVKTPHLDRLAKRGVRFERAYVQHPVCSPARGSFLSGRHTPGGLGDPLWKRDGFPGVEWMPEYFSKRGYTSISVGKMSHATGPSSHMKWDVRSRAFTPDAVLELMKEHKDKPLFVAYGPAHTHLSFRRTTPEFMAQYPPESIPPVDEPANVRDDLPAAAFEGINTRADIADAEHRKHLQSYYAAISTLDADIGKLMDGLDRLDAWENTVVLFVSDHGRHLGDQGKIYDKRTLFEASLHVPLIVVAPGKKTGAVSPRLVEMIDIFPTFVDLCGLRPPEGLEGTSFAPLLDDPERAWKPAAYSWTNAYQKGRGVRTERYRYAEWNDGRDAMLFDHEDDPREHVNLARDPAHAATVAEMRRLFAEQARPARSSQ
ncbi:MAG: sulfatase [Planctomycetaceae bacterium]